MRFRSRDLMATFGPGIPLALAGPAPACTGCTATGLPPCPFPSLGLELAGPVPPGCGCTQTALRPCPFPSLADLVTDRAGRLGAGQLEALRSQLREELTKS